MLSTVLSASEALHHIFIANLDGKPPIRSAHNK